MGPGRYSAMALVVAFVTLLGFGLWAATDGAAVTLLDVVTVGGLGAGSLALAYLVESRFRGWWAR